MAWSPAVQKFSKRLISAIETDDSALELEYYELLKCGHGTNYDSLELVDLITRYPKRMLRLGIEAFRETLPEDLRSEYFVIRLKGAEPIREPISKLRSKHLGRLVMIEGVVTSKTVTKAKIVEGAFICGRCGNAQLVAQPLDRMIEPLECPKELGGCGRSVKNTSFELDLSCSRTADWQTLEVQELPEHVEVEAEHKRVQIRGEDLCGICNINDRVRITGIFDALQRRSRGQTTPDLLYYIMATGIETEKDRLEIELNVDEERALEKLVTEDDYYLRLVRSIAPSVHGMVDIKEAIALQAFGGVNTTAPTGTYYRGDIHIAIIGDPGVAKSQILLWVSDMHPRGEYTEGTKTRRSGLIAIAMRDPFDNRWTYKWQTALRASGGILALDEATHLSGEDLAAMYELLEHGRATMNLAPGKLTVRSQFGLLAACNPTSVYIDPDQPIAAQTDLTDQLLSRLDLIYPIRNVTDERTDRCIAEHIRRSKFGQLESEAEGIPLKMLRALIAHARRIDPTIPEKVGKIADNYYVEARGRVSEHNKLRDSATIPPLSARQYQTLLRLAEARARAHLRDECNELDMYNAIEIFTVALDRATAGSMDIADLSKGGLSQLERMRMIYDMLVDHYARERDACPEWRIVRMMNAHNVNKSRTLTLLSRMESDGKVYAVGDNPRSFRAVQ